MYESAGEFQGQIVVAFNSLSDMIKSVYAGYNTGVYFLDKENRLCTNYAEQDKLMKSQNPGCKRWEEEEAGEVIIIEP